MKRTVLLSSILIMASCCCQLNEGLRILVISPMNSKSHDAMSDKLGKALAARGHQIDAISHYPPKKSIANYKHHSLEGTLPAFTNNLNYSVATYFRNGEPRQLFKKITEPVCTLMGLPLFDKLLKDPPKYDIVILQLFVSDCYLAWGRHLKVPLIVISAISSLDWYSGALGNPWNTALTPAFGTDLPVPMNFQQRLYNTVWSSFSSFVRERAFDDQKRFVERFFGPGYPSISDLRRDIDLFIVNSHHSLDGIEPLAPAIIPAAGMHLAPQEDDADAKLPEQVQRWLDDSEHGCVYFTFGSMVRIETLSEATLDAIYTAFRNIAPVRVLMKIADPAELPAALPANVLTQSWFPQVQVFKHNNVKAFITHGGLMSTIEAISSSIPMIGIPIFGDQYHNVKINVNRGIATSVDLESITADKLTEAIKDVLNTPSYKQNIDKLSAKFADRPMKPLDTAIYWVEYVARHGKKCLRSPLVDIPWWQANLLDVHGFIFSVLLVIYYTLKFLIKKICSTCYKKRSRSSSDNLQSKKKQ